MVPMGRVLELVPVLELELVPAPEPVPEQVAPEEPVVLVAPEALVVLASVVAPEVLAAQAEPVVLGATEPEATTTTTAR